MLTDEQLRLYARQVILRELGQAGQARLCAARVQVDASASEVARVASDYLQRAGLQVVDDAALPVALAGTEQVADIAGDPSLRACAEWLLGAWAAVETIKECAGVGRPAPIGAARLTAEVD